ncbi:hypothetical protein KC354_g13531 [Hortaea werneckii]|uniref:Uncharacterized protein n=1 Tax=Hortaea werneckii TaxID=91943 RepID=A0A3M7D0E2_HORWE|nr:hypothetical protein KC354_g13531 [Hortaea werneckii]RMY57734.1 hypothetical protein D0863_12517 [Hortaea werneckii]
MPKAAKQTTHTKISRTSPIPCSKPTPQNGKPTHQPKDPTKSHLYTDDNPSTTIHGTGFKDAATAHHTLDLIKNRSLTYQFQTVNTMFHRASHHPAMKKTSTSSTGSGGNSQQGMKEAMAIFRHWLDETYPAAKSALRAGGFKPLLSKPLVEKYLPLILSSASSSSSSPSSGAAGAGAPNDDDDNDNDNDAKVFAQRYINLAKGKRLGNVLLDDGDPTGLDWEGRRYRALCELVPEGKEKEGGWGVGELWEDGDGDGGEGEGDGDEGGEGGKKGKKKKVSDRHLQLIAWAWSPVGERKLTMSG